MGEVRRACVARGVAQARPAVSAQSAVPIISTRAPESLASVPATVAAAAPANPAQAVRRSANQASIRRRCAIPATIASAQIQSIGVPA